MLLVGQSAKAAADDGMFPSVFARVNRHGVPGTGLIIVAVLMTIVLFATMSPTLAGQFSRIVDLAVILVIVPYIYSAVAVVQGGRTTIGLPPATFQSLQVARARGGRLLPLGHRRQRSGTVVRAMVALLISVPLYPFFIRSMEAAAKRHAAQPHEHDLLTLPIPLRLKPPSTEAKRSARCKSQLSRPTRSHVHRATLPLAILLALAAAPVVAQDEAPRSRRPGCPRESTGSSTSTPRGRVQLRELALYESEARGAVRRPQRQLDGGVAQARAERGLHHQGRRAVLRNSERRR